MLMVNILYNAEEYFIEIDKNDDKSNYETLCQEIISKLNLSQKEGTLNLMTINTKEQFLILDNTNYSSIINEHLPDNLLKLCASIVTGDKQIPFTTNDIKNNKQESESESEDSFDNKSNSNHSDKNILNDNNKKTNNNEDNESNQIRNNVNQENEVSYEDSLNYFNRKPNLTSDTNFSDEICSICNSPLTNVKYICVICSSLIICDKCEHKHPHTLFKYKTNFLAQLPQTILFLQKMQPCTQQSKSFVSNLLSKEIEISIRMDYNPYISIRPNTEINIPFTLTNHSKNTVNFNSFALIIKGFQKVSLSFEKQYNNIINSGSEMKINMNCKSGNECVRELVEVEIYRKEGVIKNERKNIEFWIDVNEDKEDEKLSMIFNAYEVIKVLKKEYKEMIFNVMNEILFGKGPMEVYELLKKYKWDVKTIEKYAKKKAL